jgi:hypothetical protein
MKQFADGTMLAGAPELYFGIADVRDVAEGHVRAGFTPQAKGRYLITADTLSFPQIGRILRRRFGELYAFPRTTVPKFLYRAIAPALGYTRTFVERNVGYPLAFDNSGSRTELGLSYRHLDDTIAEHFQQMLDDRVVKRITFSLNRDLRRAAAAPPTQDAPRTPHGSLLGNVLLSMSQPQLRGLWPSVARAQQRAGEEIGPTSARPGDFPQALTHLALISAAGNLDRQLG